MSKHISIIVPKGEIILSSVIGSYKIFNRVNDYLKQTGKCSEDFFDVQLVGISKEVELYEGAFTVRPTKQLSEVECTDLIIVSTIVGDMEEQLKLNKEFIPWIRKQRLMYNAEVASLCVGAFLLAETGLLDGKSCALHWTAVDQFQRMHPNIKVLPEKIIAEDNGIYSSGGAYSFLNLLLYLVSKYCGRETAIWCSKMFEIELDRHEQNQFVIFNGQKDHDDGSIKNAQIFIENNFEDKISVEQLASLVAISRRNFVRRFKKATSNTPIEYIQRVKIEAAKKGLETRSDNISDIMFSVGYSDTKSFRNVFRKYTGMSPLDYKKKYNQAFV